MIKLLHSLPASMLLHSSRIATIKGKTCETRSYCNKLYRKNDYYDNDFQWGWLREEDLPSKYSHIFYSSHLKKLIIFLIFFFEMRKNNI